MCAPRTLEQERDGGRNGLGGQRKEEKKNQPEERSRTKKVVDLCPTTRSCSGPRLSWQWATPLTQLFPTISWSLVTFERVQST